ncbi:MAG TPA: hypothetical protein VGL53_01600 [Bryobacteraceae bacterium]|jgi:hypothetical protein
MQKWRTVVFFLLPAVAGIAQTQIDLRTQSKNVDFTGASATKPAKAGGTLPSTCGQGEVFFNTSAAAGQNLYVCAASNIWTQITTGSGGSGGSGGGTVSLTSTSALTDLVVTTTSSAQTLAIGSSCSSSSPCNVRFGGITTTLRSPATVSVPSGISNAGVAYIYISSSGMITVGSMALPLTCSGCSAVTGISQFPSDSIPLFMWMAAAGTWDPSGGVDVRAFLSNKSVIAGTGIVSADVAGQTVISADTSVVGLRVATPSASTATCVTGNYAVDATYFYQCLSTNIWVRVLWSTTSW